MCIIIIIIIRRASICTLMILIVIFTHTNRTDLAKCTHQYDEKQGNNNTRALSTNCLLRVRQERQITKEDGNGSKEEDRQERTDVKNGGEKSYLLVNILSNVFHSVSLHR